MDLSTFRDILCLFGDTALVALIYGYGEPLLDPTIAEKIEACSQAGIPSMISTNLLPPNRAVLAGVIDAGVDAVRFSMYGGSPETYKKYTRTDKYEEVMDNLGFLLRYRAESKMRPLIQWRFCYNNFNVGEVPDARRKAREMGIDHFWLTPMWTPPEAAREWMPRDAVREFSRDAADLTCSVHYREVTVNWDGTLRPCCRNERILEHDLGDFHRFDELWNGEVYEYIRDLSAGRREVDTNMKVPCNACEIIQGRRYTD